MFERFRKKKKAADTKGGLEMTRDGANLKSRNDEGSDPPKYFRKPREEEEVKLTEVLGRLAQRLKTLDKERADLVEEIYQLGEEAEKEAEELGRELSTLKGQTAELEEVLSTIHAHRRGVHTQELRR